MPPRNPKSIVSRSAWFAIGAAVLLAAWAAWWLEASLARPPDWFGWWSAENERTDDRSIGLAALRGGARFGPGKIGRGLDLSAPQSRADLEDWIAPDDLTLGFWLNPGEIKPARTLIWSADSGRHPPLGLIMEGGEICIAYGQTGPGANLAHSGVFPKTNVWLHLVLVSDRQGFRIFANGRAAAAQTVPEEFKPAFYTITFGRGAPNPPDAGYFGDTENFHGLIDEVALYARALSAPEARRLWLSTAWNPATRRGAIQMIEGIFFGLGCGGFLFLLLLLADKRGASAGEALSLRPRQYSVVLTVVMLGGALSAAACLRLREGRQAAGRERFQELIDRFCEQFDARTEMYAQRFISARDWLEARGDISPGEWWHFIHAASLFVECPGLVEVGYAHCVKPSERRAHESAWAAYYAGYHIHPDLPAGQRAEMLKGLPSDDQPYFPVTLQLDKISEGARSPQFDPGWDLTALGRDSAIAGSEPWTMHYAITMRQVGAAVGGSWGAKHFLQAANEKTARLYLSVTAPATNIVGPGTGRLRGLFFASIDWREFFKNALEYRAPGLSFRVSMNDGPREALLADLGGRAAPGALTRRRSVRFYRNRVYFDFSAPQELLLTPGELRWPWLAGGAWIMATALTGGLLLVQVRARLRQEVVSRQLQISRDELQAALKDRERISRDLHDGTIQSIYAITLGLGRCRKLIERKPEVASTQIEQSLGDLRNVITELREFLLTLEPELLKGQSFSAVLESMVARMQRTTDARLILRQAGGVSDGLAPREAIHLLNIVREAMSNSLRHGQAKEVLITLSQTNGMARLEIADNGAGFDPELNSEGRGLGNMAARTREIGATLHLDSKPGQGARVAVLISAKREPQAPSNDETHP